MKNLVITGDSLSYNRYDYDEVPRTNAWDCYIGMGSWSFRLRNAFLTAAPGFRYADELRYTAGAVTEITDVKNAIFGERCRNITPQDGEIRFEALSDNGNVTLYLQANPNKYCRFDIWVDGVLAAEKFDTFGRPEAFQGYALLTAELCCDKSRQTHEIVFKNFEYAENAPQVTLAGVSSMPRYAHVTGQGSRTAKFLLYHFEERIARFSPDVLVLIFGGNDCLLYSPEDYRGYLCEIFTRTRERFPACKLMTVTIPPSGKLDREIRGKIYASDAAWQENVAAYNAVMESLSADFDAVCIKTEQLFADIPVSAWRYDNIHLTKKGNDILYHKLYQTLLRAIL